jgi:outer membrane protein OmpA-like peptidoglycan-associated protein
VGRQFLHHSPSWFTPDEKGISFNHIELTLDTALTAETYYRLSFLVANMKSHKYKPAHYGVKFSEDKIVKEGQGALLSGPDVYFSFTDDDAFVEIQAVLFFEMPVKYLYFGMFSEDSLRVPKKFTPGTDRISYTDSSAYYQVVKATRVMIDNLRIGKLDKTEDVFRDIYFRLDDDQVTAEKDIDQIRLIAQKMKTAPDTYLLIQGYADPSGTYLYNLDLSSRRAAIVKAILLSQGIDERRIVTIGKGIFPAKRDGSDLGYARKVSFLMLQQ